MTALEQAFKDATTGEITETSPLTGRIWFRYQGGEVFSFEGDDDMFVFIDARLALDLGGVHSTESGSVELDTLGLTPGGVFPLDVFFAERHTDGSTFRLHLLGFDLCE